MGMMPLCIELFFHVLQSNVYPILIPFCSISGASQEDNDQAFSVAI